MSDFKKTVRDFAQTNRTVNSVFAAQDSKDDVIAAYVAGAKEAAKLTQELGEVLQAVSDAMTPQQLMKCRSVFGRNKEIVNCE